MACRRQVRVERGEEGKEEEREGRRFRMVWRRLLTVLRAPGVVERA
jgi:hypothetical protein